MQFLIRSSKAQTGRSLLYTISLSSGFPPEKWIVTIQRNPDFFNKKVAILEQG